nr:MAG TPA: hypothetical protein [Caudoviricetes sp.]
MTKVQLTITRYNFYLYYSIIFGDCNNIIRRKL